MGWEVPLVDRNTISYGGGGAWILVNRIERATSGDMEMKCVVGFWRRSVIVGFVRYVCSDGYSDVGMSGGDFRLGDIVIQCCRRYISKL